MEAGQVCAASIDHEVTCCRYSAMASARAEARNLLADFSSEAFMPHIPSVYSVDTLIPCQQRYFLIIQLNNQLICLRTRILINMLPKHAVLPPLLSGAQMLLYVITFQNFRQGVGQTPALCFQVPPQQNSVFSVLSQVVSFSWSHHFQTLLMVLSPIWILLHTHIFHLNFNSMMHSESSGF